MSPVALITQICQSPEPKAQRLLLPRARMHRMKTLTRLLTVLLISITPTVSAGAQQPKGSLVVVGGGGTTPESVSRTLALAGGPRAIVAVLPQSSAEPDAGDE